MIQDDHHSVHLFLYLYYEQLCYTLRQTIAIPPIFLFVCLALRERRSASPFESAAMDAKGTISGTFIVMRSHHLFSLRLRFMRDACASSLACAGRGDVATLIDCEHVYVSTRLDLRARKHVPRTSNHVLSAVQPSSSMLCGPVSLVSSIS